MCCRMRKSSAQNVGDKLSAIKSRIQLPMYGGARCAATRKLIPSDETKGAIESLGSSLSLF